MVVKNLNSSSNDEVGDPIDESWWAAILADEESIAVATVENSPQSDTSAENNSADCDAIQRIFEQDEIVELIVTGYNRGGLLVQKDGIQGFVPVSHLVDLPTNLSDDERREILAGYVNLPIRLKVIEFEPTQQRIVLSERAALAGEGQRKALFKRLCEGITLSGHVTNITNFGAFIDLGGVEGLVHVSELSWGRVHHPSDILTIDQEVTVQVLQVNEETSRIALSIKRLTPNPWEQLTDRYQQGDIVRAKITSMTRFGVFACLEEGVEGLVHISSINMPPECSSITQFLGVGQAVDVRILHIDADRRRLGLGFVQTE